ncbi:MAG: HAD-IIB family hydrolase [Verrucomicrobiales bacterium]|nr:HAD-IIB family hydrolase [Verrucomicrobiales bacterium]
MLLFSTDIDGTIFDGPATAEIFASFWKNLQALPEPPLLAYNSGRSLADIQDLLGNTILPGPDFIIGGVGTEIYDQRNSQLLTDWHEVLSGAWSFEKIDSILRAQIPDIEAQPDECQNAFKCSWFWHDKSNEDIERLRQLIATAGLEAQIVYSSDRDLDLLPLAANKGNALRWLAESQELPLDRVAVAGDSGNDSSMFLVESVYGVVVSNAETSLIEAVAGRNVHLASQACARGVIEGLTRLPEWQHLSPDTHSA